MATKALGAFRQSAVLMVVFTFGFWGLGAARSATSAAIGGVSPIAIQAGTDNLVVDPDYCLQNDCNTFDPSSTVDVDQDVFTANLPIVNDLGMDLPPADIPCDPLDETCEQSSDVAGAGPPQCRWWGPAYNCTPPAWALSGSVDLSAFLETCILNAADGQVVGLSAGVWRIDHQIWIRNHCVCFKTLW